MKEFTLPFKPEELLAEPADGRLWASDLPPVDDWADGQINSKLDDLIGRLLSSNGRDLAQDDAFNLIFALLQAWPRLSDCIQPRVVDLLADASRRIVAEASKIKKGPKAKVESASADLRTAAKVASFFLRWASERVFRAPNADGGRRGRGRGAAGGKGDAQKQAEAAAAAEEEKEKQRAQERQRCAVLGELVGLISRGSMPWLWSSASPEWQQVAQACSDGGFQALDNEAALKHRDTKHAALKCITDPLLQEGHQHSNLLVATVSKLIHGLRGGEGGAPFAADALLMAHTTSLPRSFLVELTQHCTGQELTSQGAFQRSLAAFLVAAAERLPHVFLANISVLLPLLDVDCYPLRQAIVESIGKMLESEGRKLPSGANNAQKSNVEEGADADDVPEEQIVVATGSDGEATFAIAPSTKKDLLETLLARSLDKSVWVRYRVLQTLTSLASNIKTVALPREQWPRVLEIATRRMQDTASMTRKAAMQLMRALVEFHPYGPALKGSGDERAKAEKLLLEVGDRLKKLQQEEVADIEKEAEAAGVELPEDGEQGGKRRRLKKKTETEQTIEREVDRDLDQSGAMEVDEEDDEEGGASARHEARQRQREALHRMQECYTQRCYFVELLDAAEARLRILLSSKTSTDVTEAVAVVVGLRLRGVPAAARAFDQVLGLVWSRHAPIKDAAVDAFHRMHLEGRSQAEAAQALLDMYEAGCANGSWTYTHLASVQELIQQAAERDLVKPGSVIPGLLEALNNPTLCPSALRALTALAASPEGSQCLLKALPKFAEALGPNGPSGGSTPTERMERVRLLCQLLYRLQSCAKPPPTDEAVATLWALSQHSTQSVVVHFIRGEVPTQWFGAAQSAMDLSFELAALGKATGDPALRSPDKMWERILGRMLISLLGESAGESTPLEDGAQEQLVAVAEGEEGAALPQSCQLEARIVASPQLGCVAFVAGHLALRMLVMLESMQSALKRKRLAEEEAKMAEMREKKKEKAAAKAKKGKGAGKGEEEEEGDAEASMGGVGAEEREAEAFAQIAEHGLLFGPNRILDRVKPLLFACLLNQNLRKDAGLRRLGAIGLCKFMTVSKRFCSDNIQLLFSVLFPKNGKSDLLASQDGTQDEMVTAAGKSGLFDDQTLRQSLLIAVGDLLFRHPNVVEPWTNRLYATLGAPIDKSAKGKAASGEDMRLTSLLVLTHLVLNDMIKARPVLLVRALWLTACSHDPTARVARILFQELSKRSTNVVYNLLPEIIARLPEYEKPETGKNAPKSTGRVQWIMQFVEKEKHIEGLIEKFSFRLEQAANAAGGNLEALAKGGDEDGDADGAVGSVAAAKESVACLANALGAMNYTDRCIIRLQDAVVVRKALNTAISYHPVVRECLLGVVEKSRAKGKPGKDKGAGDVPPEPVAEVPAEGAAGEKPKGASAASAAALDSLEQCINLLSKGKEAEKPEPEKPEPAEEEEAIGTNEAVPAKAGKKGGAKRKAAAEAEAEEEEPEEEEKASKAGKAGRGRGGGRGAAQDKENSKENRQVKAAPTGKAAKGTPAGGAAVKRRRVAAAADDDEE